jgi:hypothetical protein
MNYTVDGKNHIANEEYVFISKTTGIISKKLRLPKPELIDNYEVVKLITPADGYIYQRITDETLHNPLLLSATDSLLNYKLIPIEKESES